MFRSTVRAPQNPHGRIPVDARWYKVETQSLFGKSIGELSAWKLTGSTIIAVRRDGILVHGPDCDFILVQEDELYVLGTREQLAFFERVFSMCQNHLPRAKLLPDKMIA